MKREIHLGLMRLHLLHHACEEEVFGFGMMEELRRHGYEIGPGTFYPILHRMEEEGLLRSRRTRAGGRIRRSYRATSAGRRFLDEARFKVRELAAELFEEEGWGHSGRRYRGAPGGRKRP